MEEADRLRDEGALDYLQYRWVGAVLCRGLARLKRPVVWSTLVKIDAGPRRARKVGGGSLINSAPWYRVPGTVFQVGNMTFQSPLRL